MLNQKIVHVIGALAAGGAERFVVDLLCELRRQKINIELISLSSRMDSVGTAMMRMLNENGVPVYVGPTSKLGGKTVLWYGRKMLQVKPDIIHLHTANTELAHWLVKPILRFPPKIIRTLHSTKFYGGWLQRKALRNNKVFDVSICCGVTAVDAWSNDVAGRIVCIPNGVGFSWPIRTPDLSSEYKFKLGLDHSKIHFLSVGRMDGSNLENSPKAQDILIRAWKSGRFSEKNCVLHLLGDGVLKIELKLLADGDDGIVFHGVSANVSDWLIASDCYVMPSRNEGLPIAGIEAVGTGLSCIFSDIPPLRELSPTAVIWSAMNDTHGLENALARFLVEHNYPSNEESLLFRTKFGISAVANKYIHSYVQIVAKLDPMESLV
jgi:hypothetical protein